MIRMIQSQSAAHAKSYFSDALAKSDYYASDQELAGFWQGKLAERLGLDGVDMKDGFFALCDNLHPLTKEQLTPRTVENRTTGYDINFHCPKSVSVLHAFSEDDHILKAFQDSVTETMKVIEADTKTRVRKEGKYEDRETEELAWAHFTHQTARPIEGALPDPHLHSHCFVFNATWDDTEQRLKAAQFRDIKRDMPYYQAHFHKNLSDRLTELGYGIRRTEKSFEIEGVPQKVLDMFSKRTDEIGRIAKEKGITDAKELDGLGAKTRAKKQKGLDMGELKAEWRAQMSELGKDGEDERIVRFAPAKELLALTAEQCVDHAVLHCFERASVMDERRLLAAAYRHAIGSGAKTADIENSLKSDSQIIHVDDGGKSMCTTMEVLNEERRMVGLARVGKGKLIPAYAEAPEIGLEGQQRDAVAHVLTTSNMVSIVRGAAGTGKTTLMKEAAAKFKEAGKEMFVVAPTAQASRGVLKEEGFEGAETVAKLLADTDMQKQLQGQVLWVDEAGLLGTKDATMLLEISQRFNAQLVFGGDTRQHSGVVRGDALRILNTVANIRTAEVSKIYRQTNVEYREAVNELSKGNVGAGFNKLDKMGFIVGVDKMNPHEALVNDYVDALKRGKTALVVCPTHAQGDNVTAGIRERLKKEGMIGKKEIGVLKLKRLGFTEAEKADTRILENGQILKFNQNVTGFVRGSMWAVEKGADGSVSLTNENGESKRIPTNYSTRYDIFEPLEVPLAKGDKILINENSFDCDGRRLDNGSVLNVMAVYKSGDIVLQHPKSKALYSINREFGHIDYAHCITSHASQGKSVKEVFIFQPAGTFGATNAKQFYVSVSRAMERARVYTDDKEELLNHAAELAERQSAIELVGRTKMHKEFIIQAMREERQHERENQSTSNRKDYEPDK